MTTYEANYEIEHILVLNLVFEWLNYTYTRYPHMQDT